MTIDDDSSIYVGGLPYDATEESVRKVFDIYGAVVAVKVRFLSRHISVSGCELRKFAYLL